MIKGEVLSLSGSAGSDRLGASSLDRSEEAETADAVSLLEEAEAFSAVLTGAQANNRADARTDDMNEYKSFIAKFLSACSFAGTRRSAESGRS